MIHNNCSSSCIITAFNTNTVWHIKFISVDMHVTKQDHCVADFLVMPGPNYTVWFGRYQLHYIL